MELPQQLAGLGVHRLEPAVQRPVEGDVAGRHQRAAPHRHVLVDGPDLGPLHGIPGHEFAAIAAGPGIHVDGGADIGRAGDIAHLRRLPIHAEMLMRDVDQLRARRPGGGLPVLGAGGRRADILDIAAEGRRLVRIGDHPARLQIDALGGVHRVIGIGGDHLARQAVDDIHVAGPRDMDEDLAGLTVDRQVEQDALVDLVVVEEIMRGDLIGPFGRARIGIAGEDRRRP